MRTSWYNYLSSSDSRSIITQPETNHVVVPEVVDIEMDEDDINPVSEVEELPVGFFRTTETFREVSDSAPDRHTTAGVSMTAAARQQYQAW